MIFTFSLQAREILAQSTRLVELARGKVLFFDLPSFHSGFAMLNKFRNLVGCARGRKKRVLPTRTSFSSTSGSDHHPPRVGGGWVGVFVRWEVVFPVEWPLNGQKCPSTDKNDTNGQKLRFSNGFLT